jgi:hypothetical protein
MHRVVIDLDDPENVVLALSLFGTADWHDIRAQVETFVQHHTGIGIAEIAFFEMSVGAAVGLRLADRRRVFVKVWPPSVPHTKLRAAMQVEHGLAQRGFPCPSVLLAPVSFGDGHAAILDYLDDGEWPDGNAPAIRRAMAELLARLIEVALEFRDVEALQRQYLPTDGSIFPPPHNALFDFAATRDSAEWIDDIGRNALRVVAEAPGPFVLGHADWSAKNLRARDSEITAVYDWDSLVLDSEILIASNAAATFLVTWYRRVPATPTPAASGAFIREYEAARGAIFDTDARRIMAANVTYRIANIARCEHALPPPRTPWPGSARAALLDHGAYRVETMFAPSA